jgi:uncharacterized membrane protein YhhN
MTKPLTVLKSVGPKLVPFFKTCTIFFVLYGEDSRLESIIYCLFKILPIISLMIFVLLHGMDFSDAYAYSRKILIGLFFSVLGDVFLVWKNLGYFVPGVFMFAVAQVAYASAFGMRPFNPYAGGVCSLIGIGIYYLLLPGLEGIMVYLVAMYISLIFLMCWRAVARVQFFDDLWTWTKLCSFAGAILFLLSDFIIAFDKFRFPIPYSHALIMITYYAAQLGISLSVVDSQVDYLVQKTK